MRGFLDAVATLITRERPSRLVVCRDDDWRPQWRVDLIPSYKAHRVEEEAPAGQADVEEVPDELTPQVDMIMAMLDAFGIATAGAPGFEADDVLGTLAARERRDPVVVVSGDRDLLQLVGDDPVPVRVLYLGPGTGQGDASSAPPRSPRTTACPSTAPARPTRNWRCCAAIRPTGCPACPVSARRPRPTLLAQHGSLEHDPGRGRTTRSRRCPRRIGRSCWPRPTTSTAAEPVVRVATDATGHLSTTSDALPLAAQHPRKVAELAGEYGVTSSIGRLQKALDGLPG